MNKKVILMALVFICSSVQVDAMDTIRKLKIVNKTVVDLLLFTAQRPGSDPIIVDAESEILTLNPGEKIYFGSPRGISLLEIKDNALVQEHLAGGIKMILARASATCVTIEVDKDGYTSFKNGIEGFMCNENGLELMNKRN